MNGFIFKSNKKDRSVKIDAKRGSVIKMILDPRVLKKEYSVQRFLGDAGIAPKVRTLSTEKRFFEQIFTKQKTKNLELTNENIKALALLLKKLHSTKIPRSILEYVNNPFLNRNLYNPLLVCEKMLENNNCLQKNRELLQKKMNTYLQILKKTSYKVGLIHGDLRKENILLFDQNILLVDWEDCRIDITSCDVSQLFYLLDFDNTQENIFLKYYNEKYITKDILTMHKVLLIVYEIIYQKVVNGVDDIGRIHKLQKVLDQA
ncbi:MAG: phosphotransferase [Parcubacteria group bacterium]|nr:phosphotransferase [Parcubacteria group bacterium]